MSINEMTQYISYLLIAIGVMAFVVSVITQVVKILAGTGQDPHGGGCNYPVTGPVPGVIRGADGLAEAAD